MRRHWVLLGFLIIIILAVEGMSSLNGEGLTDESASFDSIAPYDMFEKADSPPGPEGPVPLWNWSYGGTGTDIPYSIIEVSSGGYATTGWTDSYGAGIYDMWLARIDSSGAMLWNRTFGYSENDVGCEVLELEDGGFIIAGYTQDPVMWNYNVWLVRTDEDGNHEWNVTHGYGGDEKGLALVQSEDGSLTIAGTSTSTGLKCLYLLHTDENGAKIWDNDFSTVGIDVYDMIEANNGGYVIAGYDSYSAGQSNAVIARVNEDGQLLWEHSYGVLGRERAYSLCETDTGNILVTGLTEFQGINDWDVFVMLVDELGHPIWVHTYGGVGSETGRDVIIRDNNEVVVCGYTDSYGAGAGDVWLLGLDQSGGLLWNYTFGTSGNEVGYSIVEESGGGYAIAGTQGLGMANMWVLRLPLLTWNETPADREIEFFSSMSYDLNATCSAGIHSWGLNDTANFIIDANGIISNNTILAVGEYGVQVWVNDTLGGLLVGEFTVRVQDTTPPQWDQAPVDQLLEVGEDLRYDLNASDETGLSTWRLNVTTAFSINAEGVVTTELQLLVGSYPIEVSVCDSHGNWLYGTFAVIVEDTKAPEWLVVPQNLILEYGEGLDCMLYATDVSGIKSWAVNDTDHFDISSSGHLTSIVALDPGNYWLQVSVNDTYDNQLVTVFSVTVSSEDETPPTWDQMLENQNIERGDYFVYDIDASDPSGIDSWWVMDSQYFTIDSNGVIRNNTPLIVGVYSVSVHVNDTMGNVLTGYFTLTVLDTTAPDWVTVPSDQVLEYDEALAYLLQATDLSGIGNWWINDTMNFAIDDSLITNITTLQPGHYGINVSVSDIYDNTRSFTFRVRVNPSTTTTTTTTSTTTTTTTTTTTGTTLPDYTMLIVFGGISVAILAIVIVLMRFRRK